MPDYAIYKELPAQERDELLGHKRDTPGMGTRLARPIHTFLKDHHD